MSGTAEGSSVSWSRAAVGRFFVSRRENLFVKIKAKKEKTKMAKDYKSTLNMPVTSFDMKANLPVREPKMLEYWNSIDLYNKYSIACCC